MTPQLRLGFGCSPIRGDGRHVDLEPAARAALALGYRLFDLAELYGNQRAIGRALRGPTAPTRHELFLIGKVWRTNFRPELVRKACESSLWRLGIEAFDLYLLHAPEAWRHVAPLVDVEESGWAELERRAVPRDETGAVIADDVPVDETWAAMAELRRAGLVGAIGVANFSATEVLALGHEVPQVNQAAVSPIEPNRSLVDWCQSRAIGIQAHSPLSAPGLLGEPLLGELAHRHRCQPAQIVLRWNLQRALVPLASSTDPGHLKANLKALEIELDTAEMAAIDGLARDGGAG